MKKVVFLLLFCFCSVLKVAGQGLVVDTGTYDKWPRVDKPTLSNDGKYTGYLVANIPLNSSTVHIVSNFNKWEFQLPDAGDFEITSDSKFAIILNSLHQLFVIKLGDGGCEKIDSISSFLTPAGGNGEWLSYQVASASKPVVVRNLHNGASRTFESVTNYRFSENGTALLLKENSKSPGPLSVVYLVDLSTGDRRKIWEGRNAGNFALDTAGSQAAFTSADTIDGKPTVKLWYYQNNLQSAVLRVNDQTKGMDGSWNVADAALNFSSNGDQIYFTINKMPSPDLKLSYKQENISVDVWNYKDTRLQSVQLADTLSNLQPGFVAVINNGDPSVIILNRANEIEAGSSFGRARQTNQKQVLTCTNTAGIDITWNPASYPDYYLVSTTNGSRKLIKDHLKSGNNASLSLSPGGKYVAYFNDGNGCYYTYTVASGKWGNVSKRIAEKLSESGDTPSLTGNQYGIGGWLENDEGIFIYSQYDIYLVDPGGIKKPINVTNGYGRKHHIIFRLIDLSGKPLHINVCHSRHGLLLMGFNALNKNNGFFRTSLKTGKDPAELTMGPYIYHIPYLSASLQYTQFPNPPVKARDAALFLVTRMSTAEAPNYYLTSDFRSFKKLSDIDPQKDYNWITSQLVTWKMQDGKTSQGILYKPENFDAAHKYPVIFYIYEKFSAGLNKFISPDWSIGAMDIPTYVSKGYLVFEPDIYYRLGKTGQSVLNAVVPAVDYLKSLPYVEGRKIGLDGHSFGAYEVDYLITHSHRFAAAVSASGVSDFVSGYFGLGFENNRSLQFLYEGGQNRIGATLWKRPALYIANAPVFRADRVSTPLLMMNNKQDYAVPFEQGIAFFTGLRRLGKEVYMLQYDNGLHTLGGEDEMKDFTLRTQQFFDHFLKDKPAPPWMSRGVPANEKGYYSGFK